MGRVRVFSVTTGASDQAPFPHALSTKALADGMPLKEFKAQRKKMWRDKTRAENKKAVS